jgi:hypothetical protein
MTSRHTNVTESIFHVNWDGHNHRFNGAGHGSVLKNAGQCIESIYHSRCFGIRGGYDFIF